MTGETDWCLALFTNGDAEYLGPPDTTEYGRSGIEYRRWVHDFTRTGTIFAFLVGDAGIITARGLTYVGVPQILTIQIEIARSP